MKRLAPHTQSWYWQSYQRRGSHHIPRAGTGNPTNEEARAAYPELVLAILPTRRLALHTQSWYWPSYQRRGLHHIPRAGTGHPTNQEAHAAYPELVLAILPTGRLALHTQSWYWQSYQPRGSRRIPRASTGHPTNKSTKFRELLLQCPTTFPVLNCADETTVHFNFHVEVVLAAPQASHSRLPSLQPSHIEECTGNNDGHADHHFDMDIDEGHIDYDIEMGEPLRQPSPQPNIDAEFFGPGDHLYRNYHTGLDSRPCDADGVYLPPGAPPPPPENLASDDWTPFRNRAEFETAEFLYKQNQMPAGPN
ncbi:hypothetical protein EV702DRAFT_1191282 [Suillus placidus]|uniref:Uncharacterized protein n=1 Tax=Suillus placidus TaxID=48579 RepID=A0A9P7A5I8_9AGAM|nr:hypothetical protein EV702DRAFT_1191282 [Suillus placidus]